MNNAFFILIVFDEGETSTQNTQSSETAESDIDSSQQSNITDSQLADTEGSSQVQKKSVIFTDSIGVFAFWFIMLF